MKLVLSLIVIFTLFACAHMPVVANDDKACPGLDDAQVQAMYQKAKELPDEKSATKLRTEASICEDLYRAYIKGIIQNRSISEGFSRESFYASCSSGLVCDAIFKRKWLDASFDK